MGILTVLINYLVWHYSTAVLSLFGLYRNLFVFFSNFFSLPILIRTWFSLYRSAHYFFSYYFSDLVIGAVSRYLFIFTGAGFNIFQIR
ncbi:MAG: hypothetical protein UV88_C0007G0013 [Parcubacteria group bacterium GW2011_GWA1_43_21]|nr:MAG: hypothetical protein UV88_C0007G0013 [Parcubacteria group bacterium GW2011_GWA1_43_21]